MKLIHSGDMVAVWPEAFAEVDDVYVQYSNGGERYGQVKEVSPSVDWSAASLEREGVVSSFLAQHRATPAAGIIFYTASDARKFREATQRAANAIANHSSDLDAASAEWKTRLRDSGLSFVESIATGIGAPIDGLLTLFSVVKVDDNLGSRAHLRERLGAELAHLANDPNQAASSLLRLIRERSIARRRITRADVGNHLRDDGISIVASAWAPVPDGAAYAAELADRVTARDVARLPKLELRLKIDTEEKTAISASLPRRVVLQGGHGAGKSRLSSEMAQQWLNQGRSGLHIPLGSWVDGLPGLLAAELARATGRATQPGDERAALGANDSFLILDGLDDILGSEREDAARAIAEYADRNPDLQVVVTMRPYRVPRALGGWPQTALLPLAQSQVETVLGRHVWDLPASIAELSTNPLMLGLIQQARETDRPTPSTEAELLAGYVQLLIARDTADGMVDESLGLSIASEYAFEWLTDGRLQITTDAFRRLGQRVVSTLRAGGYGESVGVQEAEAWILRIGVATRLPDGNISPSHRSLLDHLAGMAIRSRDAARLLANPALREALAQFAARSEPDDINLAALLDAAALSDLELLARCRRMWDVAKSGRLEPETFARGYLNALRRMQQGQLRGVPLVGSAVHVSIDRQLTWLNEWEIDGSTDVVEVTDAPEAMFISTPGGKHSSMVSSFSWGGRYGRQVSIAVPQFVAFDRIDDVLTRTLKDQLLPDEGPDITYERLSIFRRNFELTFNTFNRGSVAGTLSTDLRLVNGLQLLDKAREVAANLAGRAVRDDELAQVAFRFDLKRGAHVGVRRPLEVGDIRSGHRGAARNGVHVGALFVLLEEAERWSLSELPIHDLGLRPETPSDPILSLDGRLFLLHGGDLVLAVERAKHRQLDAYRYLVENNLPGLSSALRHWNEQPLGLELVVEDRSSGGKIDVWIHRRPFRVSGPSNELRTRLGTKPDEARPFEWGFSALHYFESVSSRAYAELSDDIKRAFQGSAALGSRSL